MTKAREMIEQQIAGTGVTLDQVLDPQNTHSKVSFENGMKTVVEAKKDGVASTRDGTDLTGVTYIDTCAVVIETPDGKRTTGFDAGLTIPAELTQYVEEAKEKNTALSEAERPNGITATKCMVAAGKVSAELAQDPHKGRDPQRPRSLYLSEAGTAVMREALQGYQVREAAKGVEGISFTGDGGPGGGIQSGGTAHGAGDNLPPH